MEVTYNVRIDGDEVYINNDRTECSTMYREDPETDVKMKALVSLASEMGFEPVALFDEMHWILEDMVKKERSY